MDFVIPIHPEDLEKTCVKKIIDPADVDPIQLLDDASDQILSSDIMKVAVDSSVFDVLYSFTK
jgi:hypothetical protein